MLLELYVLLQRPTLIDRTVHQTVGGAFLLAAAQSGFINQVLVKLRSLGTNVSPVLVIATGATELRDVFSGNVLGDVLVSYMTGIKVTFAITTAALGVSFLISLLSKWQRLNTGKVSGGAA